MLRNPWFKRLFPLVVVLTLAVGCKKKGTEGSGEEASGEGVPGSAEGEGQAVPVEQVVKLDATALRPVIREMGAPGVAPEKVVVEFATSFAGDLIIPEWSDATPAVWGQGGPVLKFDPPVEGSAVYTSPSTLTFAAAEMLKPATTYTVVLESVPTRDGVVTAPEDGSWKREFTTPAFGFNRLALHAFDIERRRAEVDLIFTNVVEAAAVGRAASWKVGGKTVGGVRIEATEDIFTVRATLTTPDLKPGDTLSVNLAAGIPYPADPSVVADKARGEVQLVIGKPIEILNVARRESPSGHYLEVVCKDAASEGDERYYWDREDYNSYYLSPRCQLTDDAAAEHIHFSPPVKFYVSPSGGGFRIFGDFKRGTYSMTIDAGALSVDGGVIPAEYQNSFSVPARNPQVRFVSQGRYLPRDAWRNLAITHLNLADVELSVRNVPPENLVFWLSGSSEGADERTSNLILKKKIALKGEPDKEATSWVDVGSLLPDAGDGIYELTLSNGQTTTSARLLLTSINLVAKQSAQKPGEPYAREIYVWALDMHTGEPQSGVEIKLIRPSGRTLATCTTSASGCRLEAPEGDVDQTPPFALVARKGADLTYLKFSELKTDVSDDAVQGEAWLSEVAYRMALYSDRGVYRPGETAHIAGILRDKNHVAPKEGIPVVFKLVDPRETTLRTATLKTNAAGFVTSDFTFADFATTGRYRVDAVVADKVIGSYPFSVEEFVPERMKVEATIAGEGYLATSEVPVDISARYLFGGSAAGSSFEVTCEIQPATFKPKENANLTYGVWRDGSDVAAISLGVLTGEIGEDNTGHLPCPGVPKISDMEGPSELHAKVAVFEAGSGRTTNTDVSVPVHPEKYYIGLSSSASSFEVNKPFTVNGMVVDWQGKKVDSVKKVEVEFKRMDAEFDWYWDEGDGENGYQRHLRAVPDGKTTVVVNNGQFRLDVTPREMSSAYLVRIKAGNARTDLFLEGDYASYWWWGPENRVDQTPRPERATSLNITLPELAKVGESVPVNFTAPYAGRVLLTVESHRVIQSEWLKVAAGPVTWSFTPGEFAPNLYVSAFLVKDPHLESKEAFMPDRAFGVKSVKVEPTQHTYNVKLTVPPEIRSNSKLDVTVDLGSTEGPAFVTVAAVDEGILSLTRFKDPDPASFLFARRALGVETFETVGWAMQVQPGGPSRSTGGDGLDGGGRVQAVKPVALWSGLVEVPASGKVTVSFDIPQYRGSLRVMAVAAGPGRVGKAGASVPVRDPLVLQTTLPRFLTYGDTVQVPVFVTNLTGADQQVKVQLTGEVIPTPGLAQVMGDVAPLQFVGGKEGNLRVAKDQSGTAVFNVRANQMIGAARLTVTVSAGKYTSRESLDVPFLPAGPRTHTVQRLELAKGKTDLKPLLKGWVPTSEETTVWVTANPYGDSFSHLSSLIRYPYGCIEQTTSSTRPLLVVSNLVYDVDPTLVAAGAIEAKVMSGVARLRSMQTPEGGFAYWPGESEVSYWGTAIATHLLLDAQKLKFPVPQVMVDDAVNYIADTLQNEGGLSRERGYGTAAESEAYLHYVLSLAGKGRKARIQALIDASPRDNSGSSRERLYMLQAALYLAGDRRYEKDLKSPDVSPLKNDRRNDWTFYSDLRYRGFVLSTFHDLFGNDPAGEPLAQLVARALAAKRAGYYSTQEMVWAVTGLGKWVQSNSANFSAPELIANGKSRDASPKAPGSRTSDRTWALARASEYENLSLKIDDIGSGKVYLLLMSSGVRSDGSYELGGNGMSVTRRFLGYDGSELDAANLTLGDKVFVETVVTNTSGAPIQNVAIVDRIPAGWEVENPRLGRSVTLDWVTPDELWQAASMNIRDDRVELFGNLAYGQSARMIYGVRVVSAGSYTMPPVEVEAMYDSNLWARGPGMSVEVSGPWANFLL